MGRYGAATKMVRLRIQPLTLTNGSNAGHVVLIVGVYEAKQEVELDTLTKPRDNPFKFGSGTQVMTGESLEFDRSGKTQRKRKLKQDLEQYKEEDVKEALRKGKKLVSYTES